MIKFKKVFLGIFAGLMFMTVSVYAEKSSITQGEKREIFEKVDKIYKDSLKEIDADSVMGQFNIFGRVMGNSMSAAFGIKTPSASFAELLIYAAEAGYSEQDLQQIGYDYVDTMIPIYQYMRGSTWDKGYAEELSNQVVMSIKQKIRNIQRKLGYKLTTEDIADRFKNVTMKKTIEKAKYDASPEGQEKIKKANEAQREYEQRDAKKARDDAFDPVYRENNKVISDVKYLIYDAYRTYGENDVFRIDLDEYVNIKNEQQQPVVQSEIMNVIKKSGQKDIQRKKDLNREQIRKERVQARKGFSAKGYRHSTRAYKAFKIPSKVFRNINSIYKEFSDQYGKDPVVIQQDQKEINKKAVEKFWSVNRTKFKDPKGTGNDVVSPTSQPLYSEAQDFMKDLVFNDIISQKMVKVAMVKAIKSANELIDIKNMSGSVFPKYSISQGFDYSMFAK